MTLPAARITDMHVCPMQTPATPPIPHVGGPVTGPGAPTVLIGSLLAATVSDVCVCVGTPDSIAMGSTTVLLSNKPAARMGRHHFSWWQYCCRHAHSAYRGIKPLYKSGYYIDRCIPPTNFLDRHLSFY